MKFMMLKIALLVALPMATHAQSPAKPDELAKKSGCMGCHAMEKKVLGPGFKDVAAKYKGEKGADVKLAGKIRAGSQGTWGPIPMPANTQLKDNEIKSLVQWVLAIK